MGSILKIEKVSKVYTSGESSLKVLDDVNFDIEAGDIISIVGPSGSGKTTLLGLCAGLDKFTEGEVVLCGKVLSAMSEDECASLRNEKVGFVFQNFQLIPTLTAIENVMIPLELQGKRAYDKAVELLDRVGLPDRMHHYPSQLSGGEQQRVSIARAFINEPEILFADEPTGNLDTRTGERIIDLLFQLNASVSTTLVLVTHDQRLAERCDRRFAMTAGELCPA